jgi:penicillin-binding protein 2
MPERYRDNALYMAYAPVDKPQIALALVLENAGWGGAAAAPIARRVFDYWLMNQYPNEQDLAAVQKGQAQTPLGQPRAVADVPGMPVAPAAGVATAAVTPAIAASATVSAVALASAASMAPMPQASAASAAASAAAAAKALHKSRR